MVGHSKTFANISSDQSYISLCRRCKDGIRSVDSVSSITLWHIASSRFLTYPHRRLCWHIALIAPCWHMHIHRSYLVYCNIIANFMSCVLSSFNHCLLFEDITPRTIYTTTSLNHHFATRQCLSIPSVIAAYLLLTID